MWTYLRRVPVPIAVLFALAGFIPAYYGSDYSASVSNLYAQNNQMSLEATCTQGCRQMDGRAQRECELGCKVSSREEWYRRNVALTSSADRQWPIWGLSFPAAMVLAVFASICLGWLPAVDGYRVFLGALILFGSSLVVVLLVMFLQFLSLLMAPVAYAFLLSRASRVMVGDGPGSQGAKRPTFGWFVLCIPAGMILGGVLQLLLSNFTWYAGIEITWGFAFGASLVPIDE